MTYGLVNMICQQRILNETDRVWEEVKPLYDALHCHVRAKLNEHYGDEAVPDVGPLPVHLLGNMWGHLGQIYTI